MTKLTTALFALFLMIPFPDIQAQPVTPKPTTFSVSGIRWPNSQPAATLGLVTKLTDGIWSYTALDLDGAGRAAQTTALIELASIGRLGSLAVIGPAVTRVQPAENEIQPVDYLTIVTGIAFTYTFVNYSKLWFAISYNTPDNLPKKFILGFGCALPMP